MTNLCKCIIFISLFSYTHVYSQIKGNPVTVLPIPYWSLHGNAGTVPGINFLGTTDTNRLVFRTNNIEQATILPNGNFGIGTPAPTKPLYVAGNNVDSNAEVVIRQIPGSALGAYITLDNRASTNGKFWSIGSTGSRNFPGVNGSLEFYQRGPGTRMIIDSNGRVGIGVISPTAQLHTTGTVRFQGIAQNNAAQNYLVTDNSGNVYYSSIANTAGWSLTGNSGTAPGTNFIGTTDAKSLVFKTNNVTRLTILPSGYTGLNNSAPQKLLSLTGASSTDNAEILVQQLAGSSLGAYLTLDNTANGGKLWSIGSTGITNSPGVNGTLEFYEYGYGTRMLLDPSGRLGLALGGGILPTANLHVNGSVRFQNLPVGGGKYLVVDDNGNVYQSSNSIANSVNPGSSDASANIDNLQSEVNDLKQQILELKSLIKTCNPGVNITDNAVLFQNVPNPSASSSTLIKLYIPASKRGDLVITDMDGKTRKTFSSLQSGNQQVLVTGSELGNGTFLYSLYVDGVLFQSKKMVIAQ